MPSKFKTSFAKIKDNQRQYCLTGMKTEPWYKRLFYKDLTFLKIMWREMMSNRLFMRASSVTYTTTLALIPMLVVCGSFVLMFNRKIKQEDIINSIVDFIGPLANPDSDQTIVTFLSNTLSRALDFSMGPIGIIALLVTSVMLFITIQDSVNDLWHVKKSAKFYIRILWFYAIVTLGPVLVSISIYQSTQLINQVADDPSVWAYLSTAIYGFIACFLLFKFLPNTHVQFKHAIVPALAVSLLFEVFKFGYSLYMTFAFQNSYSVLYGTLALVPLTLLGIYILWMILFMGVLSCYVTQNFRELVATNFFDENTLNQEDTWIFMGPYAPIEVVGAIVREFQHGNTPVTAQDIAIACQYPTAAIEAILTRLIKNGLVNLIETDTERLFVVAKPLDMIDLNTILDAFDESSPRTKPYQNLNEIVSNETAERHERLLKVTAQALREPVKSPGSVDVSKKSLLMSSIKLDAKSK